MMTSYDIMIFLKSRSLQKVVQRRFDKKFRPLRNLYNRISLRNSVQQTVLDSGLEMKQHMQRIRSRFALNKTTDSIEPFRNKSHARKFFTQKNIKKS